MSKPLTLAEAERKTLLEMSIFHPHNQVRQRARAMRRIGEEISGKLTVHFASYTALALTDQKLFVIRKGG